LSKNDDIFHYFQSLGLPDRPPTSASSLYNRDREETGTSSYWADLSQSNKDDYIKRLVTMKRQYYQNLIQFVEHVLPSDYVRLEFFRNVKNATKDYQVAIKDRPADKLDEGQLKITQYLTKKAGQTQENNEFERIRHQLLATPLNNEQKELVERLGQLMRQWQDSQVGVIIDEERR
jgi:hypothetical protein